MASYSVYPREMGSFPLGTRPLRPVQVSLILGSFLLTAKVCPAVWTGQAGLTFHPLKNIEVIVRQSQIRLL